MSPAVNPFTPHQPIDPEFFAGRMDEIEKIVLALNQTRHGKTQHVMLTGERGIGKSSLAIYADYLAKKPNQIVKTDFCFATAYYTVQKGQSLQDVCQGLTAALLDNIERGLAARCLQGLKNLNLHFSIHVPGVGEISTSSCPEAEVKTCLQADFVKTIKELWNEIKETHNGILLIVDELHNLADLSGIGSFLKVISEAWTVAGYRQITFIIVGLPHIPDKLSEDDKSAPRIFNYVQLRRLTMQESLAILHRCLEGTAKTIDDEAAKSIAIRSGGFPYFLHQLGYDAFQCDVDGVIDGHDVANGLFKSLVQFERMFFGKMYKLVEGKQKQKIVDELARHGNKPQKATELEDILHIKNIHQYLKGLESDGLIERTKGRVRLVSDLLAIYIRLFKAAPGATYDEEPPPWEEYADAENVETETPDPTEKD